MSDPRNLNGHVFELGIAIGEMTELQRRGILLSERTVILLEGIHERIGPMPAQKEPWFMGLITSVKDLAREVYPVMALVSLSLFLMALIWGRVTWDQLPQMVGVMVGGH